MAGPALMADVFTRYCERLCSESDHPDFEPDEMAPPPDYLLRPKQDRSLWRLRWADSISVAARRPRCFRSVPLAPARFEQRLGRRLHHRRTPRRPAPARLQRALALRGAPERLPCLKNLLDDRVRGRSTPLRRQTDLEAFALLPWAYPPARPVEMASSQSWCIAGLLAPHLHTPGRAQIGRLFPAPTTAR
jgi:hypothetical protein